MQLRIRTAEYTLEFEGSPEIWNEFLRPLLGGPEVSSAPAPPAFPTPPREEPRAKPSRAPAPAAAPRPRTNGRPGDEPAPAARSRSGGPPPGQVYGRLAGLAGRRGQKDAVAAAVWYLTATQEDATPDEVERHLREHGFGDFRVKPVMLKHVSRSRMLGPGVRDGSVQLTVKGAAYVENQLLDPSAAPRGEN